MQRLRSIRALALGVLALVLMAAMSWLGLWQLGVYDDHQHAEAQAALRQPAVPLEQMLGPDDAFPDDGTGRPVIIRGTFVASEQIYVRNMSGALERYAVVTPLRTSSGSAVLVVRGASSTPDVAQASVPAGRVTVRGYLEPSEAAGSRLDGRRVTDALAVSALVDVVDADLYSGYVLQETITPAAGPGLALVTPTLPDPSRWSGIRNLLYACQWWVFAGFVAFMWWRITDPRFDGPGTEAGRGVVQADADSATLTALG